MKKISLKKKQKTIKFDELGRLAFCNSRKLPKVVVIGEVVHRWVGIGWMTEDTKPTPKMVRVID